MYRAAQPAVYTARVPVGEACVHRPRVPVTSLTRCNGQRRDKKNLFTVSLHFRGRCAVINAKICRPCDSLSACKVRKMASVIRWTSGRKTI